MLCDLRLNDTSLYFSENWHHKNIYRLLWRLNEIIHAKSLEKCLAHSKHSTWLRLLVVIQGAMLRKCEDGHMEAGPIGKSKWLIYCPILLPSPPFPQRVVLESCTRCTGQPSCSAFAGPWTLLSGLGRQIREALGQPANNSVFSVEQAAGKWGVSLLQKIVGQSGVERSVLLSENSLAFQSQSRPRHRGPQHSPLPLGRLKSSQSCDPPWFSYSDSLSQLCIRNMISNKFWKLIFYQRHH